jgi:hypothetical protein
MLAFDVSCLEELEEEEDFPPLLLLEENVASK